MNIIYVFYINLIRFLTLLFVLTKEKKICKKVYVKKCNKICKVGIFDFNWRWSDHMASPDEFDHVIHLPATQTQFWQENILPAN